jgi:hypothetical protein
LITCVTWWYRRCCKAISSVATIAHLPRLGKVHAGLMRASGPCCRESRTRRPGPCAPESAPPGRRLQAAEDKASQPPASRHSRKFSMGGAGWAPGTAPGSMVEASWPAGSTSTRTGNSRNSRSAALPARHGGREQHVLRRRNYLQNAPNLGA